MLVAFDEFRQYMNNYGWDADQEAFITNVILPGIQGELETYCNRPLEPVHVREQCEPDQEGYIYFQVTPIRNFISITRSDGQAIDVPLPKPQPLPALVPVPGVTRTRDYVGVGMVVYPHKLYVGPIIAGLTDGAWSTFLTEAPLSYLAEYVGGWDGENEPGLKTAIMRVAARETENLDETMALHGNPEAAKDADDRPKFWTDEELKRWDRLRRRTVG